MAAAPLLGGSPRPLMAQCVALLLGILTGVWGRETVDHAACAGCPKWGPHPQVWAHDSSALEGRSLTCPPTTGHRWCLYSLLMVPASSMHGGSHQVQVAGATGACLHAWVLRKSVSAQCTPTPRRCTAWQGMSCERCAWAIHKRSVRWRKHSTRHQRLLQEAPGPRLASHPVGGVLGLCTSAVHHRLQAAGSPAAAAGNDVKLSVLAPAMKPSAPSNGALHCYLSPFARTGNPTNNNNDTVLTRNI